MKIDNIKFDIAKKVLVTKRSLGLFVLIFILTSAFITGIVLVFYRSEINTQLASLKKQEAFSVELQSRAIEDIFHAILGDLFFLKEQNELQEYFSTGDPSHLDKVADEYISLSGQKKIYDQIRFIDEDGIEIVRVNYKHGNPDRVPKNKLQSKGNRNYFKDCFKLGRKEVFISPFDLNIEHGKIEKPYKPMIHIGSPVFDSKGVKRGIVLLNYLGNNLLMKIVDLEGVSEGQTMMLNSEGYWLLSRNNEQEWGFVFQNEEMSFSRLHKDIWEEIISKKNGQINTPEGIFTFKTVYPLKYDNSSKKRVQEVNGNIQITSSSDEYKWHLVSFVPSYIIDSYSESLLNKLFPFGIAVFLLISNWSWLITFAITKRRVFQERLREMALFDSLTGLPNRRVFFDRLHIIIEQSKRYDAMFALLYIDLDGFKIINDTFGHEAGDELLCEVANVLKRSLRKSDTVARLGGDEFAVILVGIKNAGGADVAAKKILSSISKPIALTEGIGKIGASIGISIFPSDSDDPEILIRIADKCMYESKQKGKNTYTTNGG
jgi:diguanylate cyclase (GGDEF)-like protein